MAEQEKNELIWARNSANGVAKEMTRKKFDMLSSAPNSGWEECDAPETSPHAGIVIVSHDEDGQEIQEPSGGLQHSSSGDADPHGEQSPTLDQSQTAPTAAKQKKETA